MDSPFSLPTDMVSSRGRVVAPSDENVVERWRIVYH